MLLVDGPAAAPVLVFVVVLVVVVVPVWLFVVVLLVVVVPFPLSVTVRSVMLSACWHTDTVWPLTWPLVGTRPALQLFPEGQVPTPHVPTGVLVGGGSVGTAAGVPVPPQLPPRLTNGPIPKLCCWPLMVPVTVLMGSTTHPFMQKGPVLP